MKALILERPGQATLIDSALYPLFGEPYDAVLGPAAVAPYSSDVNTVYGSSSKKPDNLILGRECIARVEAVVSCVRDFQIDDLVAVPAATPDWRNVEIQEGNDRHVGRPSPGNTLGRSISSAFAETFGIADVDTTLTKLLEGVHLEDALMYVDTVTTGLIDVEAAGLKFSDTVVVLGIGVVGLMAVQGAALQGAVEIYAVSTREINVQRVLEFGATEILSYKDGDIREQVMAKADGRGVDAVFVYGGNDDTFWEIVDMVHCDIGRVVNLKRYPGDDDIGIPKFSDGKGMAGKTVHLELCRGERARMERLLRLVETGKVKPERMITRKLEDFLTFAKGLELMRREPQDLIRVMVCLSSGGREQQAQKKPML